MEHKQPRPILGPRQDQMKHFSKETAGVKLTALLLCQLPFIFWSLGTVVAAGVTAYLIWGR
jgi:hypothetical protein